MPLTPFWWRFLTLKLSKTAWSRFTIAWTVWWTRLRHLLSTCWRHLSSKWRSLSISQPVRRKSQTFSLYSKCFNPTLNPSISEPMTIFSTTKMVRSPKVRAILPYKCNQRTKPWSKKKLLQAVHRMTSKSSLRDWDLKPTNIASWPWQISWSRPIVSTFSRANTS